MSTSKEMAKLIHKALEDKLAEDIKIINIEGISVMADYFIVANGNNPSQVKALVDNVEGFLSKEGYEPKQIEGTGSVSWILMDYGDVIVHIFSKEDRLFYDLERIWRDGKDTQIDEL